MRRITALLISLWLGFHLSVGCVVAPLVSNHLNTSDSGKTLADTLSARLSANQAAENQLRSQLAQAQTLIALYKALGGGWAEK